MNRRSTERAFRERLCYDAADSTTWADAITSPSERHWESHRFFGLGAKVDVSGRRSKKRPEKRGTTDFLLVEAFALQNQGEQTSWALLCTQPTF